MIGVHLRLSAAALLLLTGCAELRWHKDGADAAALERDLAECRQQARVLAARETLPLGSGTPRIVGVDERGRAIVGQAERQDTDRMLAEQDYTRRCMSKKGWELAPAEKR